MSRDKVSATLADVGFSEEGQAAPITSLSGGWKMKLALARAMLQEAQVRTGCYPMQQLFVRSVLVSHVLCYYSRCCGVLVGSLLDPRTSFSGFSGDGYVFVAFVPARGLC